jgi:deoxyribodipyrimidine photo-lyase
MAIRHDTDPAKPVLVLFRHDLRIADNRALSAAAATGKPVIPVFILDDASAGMRPAGAARRWWLHHSISALARGIEGLGCRLVLRRGPCGETVRHLLSETGADMVLWNRRYAPVETVLDTDMTIALRSQGIATENYDGHLLHEPSRLQTASGGAYRVFTPFWRALSSHIEPRDAVDTPRSLRPFPLQPRSDALAEWQLLPKAPDWAAGFKSQWTPGEAGARKQLANFVSGAIETYAGDRDIPAIAGTSRLSPHLANGEITPFQILAALRRTGASVQATRDAFRRQIGWREFSYHLLFHNPDLARTNVNRDFDRLAWLGGDDLLRKWQNAQTGYPLIDAGMRELWQTGWMHNRVRMVVASFLVKHLLIDWRRGEEWFWDTLVDADAANNAASWQWVAGSGADAAPYFRIFNPILQGRKFDPHGAYVRRYVPELAELPDQWLQSPWEAPHEILERARVKLGADYPVAVVDHRHARQRALSGYRIMRGIT